MILNSILRSDNQVYYNKKITGDGIGKPKHISSQDHISFISNRYIINEILEGNLLTAARLEEVMKKTKFIKRILNFFMPSK